MEQLYKWNLYCGTLHAVQGSIQMFLGFANDNASAFKMPVSSLFQNWDEGYPVQVQGLVGYFVLLRAVAWFSLLSAIAHFNVLWQWDTYTEGLKAGKNRFRWWEYSISGSLIMTLLFVLWGNFDWVQIGGCFMTQWCCMLFGDMHEVLNAGKAAKDVDWTMFWYGSILGSVAWFVMYYELWRIPSTEDLPWWVWLALGMY